MTEAAPPGICQRQPLAPARLRAWLLGELRMTETRYWAVTLAGYAGRFGLGFVASITIARWLGPTGYGLVALVGMVVAMADTIGDLGLTHAATRAIARSFNEAPDHAHRLAHAFLLLSLCANGAAAAVGLLLAEPVARLLLGRPDAEPYLRLGLLGLIPLAGSGFAAVILQSTHRFAHLAALQVVTAASYLLGITALALSHHLSVASVVLLGAVNPLVGVIVGLRLAPAGLVSLSLAARWPGRRAIRELTAFGTWMWISAVLSLLGSQLDLLLLAHWAPPVVVGVYALAFNLALRLDMLNQARFTVLVPTVSALRSRAEISAYLRRSLPRSALLSLPLLLAAPLADPFILTFYGPAFADSAPLLRALLLVVVFDFVTTPLLLVAFPLNAPKVMAGADLIRVATLVGAGALLIPAVGPIGAALAKLASRVLGAAFALAVLWRLAADPRRAARSAPETTP